MDAISSPETQALSLAVLDPVADSALVIVRQVTDDTKSNKGLVHVSGVLGSSVRTRDVSAPFWAAVEGWLRDGVCFICGNFLVGV